MDRKKGLPSGALQPAGCASKVQGQRGLPRLCGDSLAGKWGTEPAVSAGAANLHHGSPVCPFYPGFGLCLEQTSDTEETNVRIKVCAAFTPDRVALREGVLSKQNRPAVSSIVLAEAERWRADCFENAIFLLLFI